MKKQIETRLYSVEIIKGKHIVGKRILDYDYDATKILGNTPGNILAIQHAIIEKESGEEFFNYSVLVYGNYQFIARDGELDCLKEVTENSDCVSVFLKENENIAFLQGFLTCLMQGYLNKSPCEMSINHNNCVA